MPAALDKWIAKHFPREEEGKSSDARLATEIGGGTTAALAAAFTAKHELKDLMDNKGVRRKQRFQDFKDQLQPGDILFHHRSAKNSARPQIRDAPLPGTEADYMMGIKGDPFYHTSIYKGRGKLADAFDVDIGITGKTPLEGDTPENIRAYRPSGGQSKALDYAKKAEGGEYMSFKEMLDHGASHLFDPRGGPDTTRRLGCHGQACTQFVANAYKDIFPKQYASPADMRHSPELNLIARYEPMGDRTLREIALTRGLYPVLKNLTKGAAVGVGAYAGLKALRHYKERKKDHE